MKIHYLALLALALGFSSCEKTKTAVAESKAKIETAGDVTFARTTFESLARGDAEVAKKIDWPVFTSWGENVGVAYTALTSGAEKERFISNFITQFSTAFREGGGSVDAYTNWRVVSHDSQRTEVAADSSKGILSIIVSERNGEERVSSINVVR